MSIVKFIGCGDRTTGSSARGRRNEKRVFAAESHGRGASPVRLRVSAGAASGAAGSLDKRLAFGKLHVVSDEPFDHVEKLRPFFF